MSKKNPNPKWISKRRARKWAKNYRKWIKKPKERTDFLEYISFEKEDVERLLDQKGAKQLRVHFGYHKNNDDPRLPHLPPGEKVFLTAVGDDGKSILEPEPLILDLGVGCPPDCDPPVGGGGGG